MGVALIGTLHVATCTLETPAAVLVSASDELPMSSLEHFGDPTNRNHVEGNP